MTSPSYVDPFGGGTVQPAIVSYGSLALSESTALYWPQDSILPTRPALYRIMDITPSGSGFALQLPDARKTAAGYDSFFSNRGGSTFTLQDSAGNTIGTVAAGQTRYVYLTDNSTAAGTWRTFVMGVGSSSVDAASLAGMGLFADGALLATKQDSSTFSTNYTLLTTDLSKSFVWTGGAGTLTLLSGVTATSKFFFSLANQGTGLLTVQAQSLETIDGSSSISLQPGEACYVQAVDGSSWVTVGRGRSSDFNYSFLTKSVTGGTVVLSLAEASNTVQDYVGVLTSNCIVELPPTSQVYYMRNSTTGSYSLTFKTASVGATTVTLAQGRAAVIVCDGVDVFNASTAPVPFSAVVLDPGTAANPGLQFPDASGFYQPAPANVAIAVASAQVLNVAVGGVTVTGDLDVSGDVGAATGTFTGLITAPTAPTLSNHLTNKGYVDALVANGGFLYQKDITTAYTAVLADKGYMIRATSGTFTLDFTAAATLGNGWYCYVFNAGSGDVTVQPNGAETIDGLVDFVLYPGAVRLVYGNGTALFSIPLKGGTRVFNGSGTYIVPPNISGLRVTVTACGGSGGRGATAATGNLASGGPGGGGGETVQSVLSGIAAGTSVTVTAPAGPAGVAGTATTSQLATIGNAGSDASFGSYVSARAGTGASIGGIVPSTSEFTVPGGLRAVTGSAPYSVTDSWLSGRSYQGIAGVRGVGSEWAGGPGGPSTASTDENFGLRSLYGGGGGGAGGLVNSGNADVAAGQGGASGRSAGSMTVNRGFGGTAGAVGGGAGGHGGAVRPDSYAGDGGGGGGANAAGNGGRGGDGANPGGGGGGGGGCRNGSTSGRGGDGGDARVTVEELV